MQVATDEAILKASRLALANEMIQHLPQGYDTYIGDGGVRLSGGQRQRVGLARAVFGDPRLIVLDEPNANLDQAGETALVEAIENLKRSGVALVLVGHRPSTLSVADKVLFLKEGHVVMFGERDEVLEELKARASESIPQGGDHKWPRRLTPDRSPSNGSDRNAKAMTGVS
jgi:ABC-type protease/lipase transport system fused ATPase/permease subunit